MPKIEFHKVAVADSGPLTFTCIDCGAKVTQADKTTVKRNGHMAGPVFANLQGKPFVDYYCQPCAVKIQKPVGELGCACCGGCLRGRQWWNQDTGYGICDGCIEFVRKRGMSENDIRDTYGFEGVHWGIK